MQRAALIVDISKFALQSMPERAVQIALGQCPQLHKTIEVTCWFDIVGQKNDPIQARHLRVTSGMKANCSQNTLVRHAEVACGDVGRKQGMPDFDVGAILGRKRKSAAVRFCFDLLDVWKPAAIVKQARGGRPNSVLPIAMGQTRGVVHCAERVEEPFTPDRLT